MADQLYLSYRIRGYNGVGMLRTWEKVLRLFPYSKLTQNWSTLKIQAVSYEEPLLREQPLAPGFTPDDVLAVAKDAFHDDSAYSLETWWDIWQYLEDWRVEPARVTLACYGPRFESETEENLRIEFGPDTQFLPQPGIERGAHMAQSNLRSLLHLVHTVDDALAVEQRRLWTESGENFAERLQAVLH